MSRGTGARRRAHLCAALPLVLAACAAPAAPPPSSPPAAPVTTGSAAAALTLGAEWPTYHGDVARSGAVANGPDPASPAVAWRATLDGAVYASPLIARGLVVAATEGGTLYGLDAATGATVWRTHLADPVPAGDLPCGNITPTVGITGTPAYDAATGQVFAVATTQGLTAAETATRRRPRRPPSRRPRPRTAPDRGGGRVRHVLFGVDLLTGQIRTHRAVDARAPIPPPTCSAGRCWSPTASSTSPYGGNFGDCGAYIGRVVGAPITRRPAGSSSPSPPPREGGIWAPARAGRPARRRPARHHRQRRGRRRRRGTTATRSCACPPRCSSATGSPPRAGPRRTPSTPTSAPPAPSCSPGPAGARRGQGRRGVPGRRRPARRRQRPDRPPRGCHSYGGAAVASAPAPRARPSPTCPAPRA